MIGFYKPFKTCFVCHYIYRPLKRVCLATSFIESLKFNSFVYYHEKCLDSVFLYPDRYAHLVSLANKIDKDGTKRLQTEQRHLGSLRSIASSYPQRFAYTGAQGLTGIGFGYTGLYVGPSNSENLQIQKEELKGKNDINYNNKMKNLFKE